MSVADGLRDWIGQTVVVDVTNPTVYIGRLDAADEYFVTLADADDHELRGGTVSKEIYVMEAIRNGLQPSRKLVKLKQAEILSLSRAEDIILY